MIDANTPLEREVGIHSYFSASVLKQCMINSALMHVNVGIWDKLTRLVLFLLLLAGLVALFFTYLPLIQQNERYRKEILRLDGAIAREDRLARQLQSQISSVQNDPRTLERLAREKLGLAKTNETVIYFEGPRR